jgi:hypothetical protein
MNGFAQKLRQVSKAEGKVKYHKSNTVAFEELSLNFSIFLIFESKAQDYVTHTAPAFAALPNS